jgi:glycerophosphoryl diester phosphodiesterase
MMIMGHRGAAALEPENTLLSVSKAMEIGVDAVEVDVHLTKDGELVVIHDETVERTTNGKGLVSSYSLNELKRLDAGKGEQIPTLQEIIELTDRRVKLVVELKEKGTEKRAVELIGRNNLYDYVCLISFWHRLAKSVKDRDKRIETGVLLVGCPLDAAVAVQACADALVMKYTFVDGQFVEIAHKEGLKVIIWNIDSPHLVKPYADMGVDGMGSNDPRILVSHFRDNA